MEQSGAGDGELVLVSGHPGHTDRLNTVAHLDFLRDRVFPYTLRLLFRREVLLRSYSERSKENARQALEELFGVENSRKARLGGLAGLQTPAIMEQKKSDERKLREAVAADPRLKDQIGDPWSQVAAAIKVHGKILDDHSFLERGTAFNSQLFSLARGLVRMAEETPSRTRNACGNTPSRAAIRSRCGSSPRRRSTAAWRSRLWPTR